MPAKAAGRGVGSRRLADILAARIVAGHFDDSGGWLPTELELMGRYQVGRHTVRQAVAILRRRGLVETVPSGKTGGGTKVRPRKIAVHVDAHFLTKPTGGERCTWAEECARQGHVGTTQITYAGPVKAPPEVVNVLGSGLIIGRYRVEKLDGDAAHLLNSYYPGEWAQGTPIASRAAWRPSVLFHLEKDLGFVLALATTEYEARSPTDDEARRLGLLEGVPVFDLTRVITGRRHGDVTDRPVLMDRGTYAGDRCRLRVEDIPLHG